MIFKFNKVSIFIIFFFILFTNTNSFSSNLNFHSKENVTNYIYGILSFKENNNHESLDSFKKIKNLEKIHSPFKKHYIFDYK